MYETQQGDTQFLNLLNSVRIGVVGDENIKLLKSRMAENLVIPGNAIYLFAKNLPEEDNRHKLDLLNYPPLHMTKLLRMFLKTKLNKHWIVLLVNLVNCQGV